MQNTIHKQVIYVSDRQKKQYWIFIVKLPKLKKFFLSLRKIDISYKVFKGARTSFDL